MLFSSMEFLFVFFPIALAVNFALPKFLRNYWLLAASLFFYAWGDIKNLLLFMASIAANYLIALGIGMSASPRRKKAALVLGVLFNVCLLLAFKYLNFATSVLRSVLPWAQAHIPQTSVLLPLGISFFTFQALSYLIDVYRGMPCEKNIVSFALYISFFPQLVQGPIVRYGDISSQLTERRITLASFSEGLLRFLVGVNKKILIANVLSEAAQNAFGGTGISAGMAWLGALCYTLQIYFDFSGYSDMALGLGRMFGFTFRENFDYPYISSTVTEFWRRWHISLGTWFRDYVYFPLGGSRTNRLKIVRNLLIVWILTGIWHGANWNFIAWGLFYGILIIFEKLTGIPKKMASWPVAARALYRAFTLLAVVFGWVLFNSDGFANAWTYIKAMFALSGNAMIGNDLISNLRNFYVTIIIGIIGSAPVFRYIRNALEKRSPALGAACHIVYCVVQPVLFAVSVANIVLSGHNPFLYFNF